ncbi:MAG: hypothetical protein ACLU0O_00905 [Collinsella sp.]
MGANGHAPYKAVVRGLHARWRGPQDVQSLGNVIDPNKVCDRWALTPHPSGGLPRRHQLRRLHRPC